MCPLDKKDMRIKPPITIHQLYELSYEISSSRDEPCPLPIDAYASGVDEEEFFYAITNRRLREISPDFWVLQSENIPLLDVSVLAIVAPSLICACILELKECKAVENSDLLVSVSALSLRVSEQDLPKYEDEKIERFICVGAILLSWLKLFLDVTEACE